VVALTGMQQPDISDIGNGVHNLTVSTMVALAHAVGMDVRTWLKHPSGSG
jgi:plasmid maintenance system antidote protein VapI